MSATLAMGAARSGVPRETDAGDVSLVHGERLVVRETHHFHSKQTPDVTRRIDGATLSIEDNGCTGGALWHGGGCSTDFHVQVPPGIALRIITHAGNVRATGVDARTDAGNVDVAVPTGTYAI